MIDLSYLRDQSQAPCTYLPKLTKKFLRAEGSVHFRVENIYGRELPFFTRFMPTNGFVQPFVGIISFLSVFHGAPSTDKSEPSTSASVMVLEPSL